MTEPRFVLGIADKQTYEIVEDGRAIRCNVCGRTSWNLNDVKEKYCGACDLFHPILTRFYYDDRSGKT